MDIPICPPTKPCKHPADILSFFSKSCCSRCYMKRLTSSPYSVFTHHKKMQVKELLLSSFFQVLFDKLASGLMFAFANWDRIHVKIKSWSRRLSSIQAQIEDNAGEKQWLRSAVELAREVTELLDEIALFPGAEDLKETTRKMLGYGSLPCIASTDGTQEEEDNVQLPPTNRGKSSKWKKKYHPRKLYQRKSIKWKKKHPPKHKKDDIPGPSSATKENHDQLIYSMVHPLASSVAAWMLQRKPENSMELFEEKTPAQKHGHIHKEQSSPQHKWADVITSAELNTEPRTAATLDSTLGKITALQTRMDRRLVKVEKMLHHILSCIEKRDASPICPQDRKRRCAPKLPPAKRQNTQGPEVAKYPNTLVPTTPVVDTTSTTPTLFFCSFLL